MMIGISAALKKRRGVFSQGETLEELEDNIRDAYKMMIFSDSDSISINDKKTKDILLDVA